MLVRLPDGTLRHIDHLKPARVNDGDVEGEALTPATLVNTGRHAIVMVLDGRS
jgi:hypothetical protein